MIIYRSYSSEETKLFSERFAKKITNQGLKSTRRKYALVFALSGNLGSGKTTFIQGFLRGLGARRKTASPTFILFRRFMLRTPRFRNLYHVDAYRLKKPREFLKLGLGEIFQNPRNIVLIEWAEKLKNFLPGDSVKISFFHGRKENERKIKIAQRR